MPLITLQPVHFAHCICRGAWLLACDVLRGCLWTPPTQDLLDLALSTHRAHISTERAAHVKQYSRALNQAFVRVSPQWCAGTVWHDAGQQLCLPVHADVKRVGVVLDTCAGASKAYLALPVLRLGGHLVPVLLCWLLSCTAS